MGRKAQKNDSLSSEPGNESFFCALRPIPRMISLRRRDYASQVQIGEPSRLKPTEASSSAPALLTGIVGRHLHRTLHAKARQCLEIADGSQHQRNAAFARSV